MSGTDVKLSVAIIAMNEERNIERCLASVHGIADEVVVVDSGSTDRTLEICAAHGARVVHQAFLGHIEQKNLAWSLTTGTHVLSLDADEALSDALRASLLAWKTEGTKNPHADVVWAVHRLTNYRGHWVRHGGWYPDRKVRLAGRDAALWTGENPHDRLEAKSKQAREVRLKGDLLHHSYYDLADHLNQIHFFSDIAALASNRRQPSSRLEIWARQGFQFLKNVLLRGGWRDGRAGWQIAWWSAHATGEKYRKISDRVRGIQRLRAAGRSEVRRIWICRTDGIGDGVVTLPIAGWLRQEASSGVELVWVCRPYAAAVGEACADIDRVVTWSPGAPLPSKEALPDLVILAYPDRALLTLLVAAGVPVVAGSARRMWTWRHLSHGVWQSRKRSGQHEGWHGLQLLAPVRLLPGMAKPGRQLPGPSADLAQWLHMRPLPLPSIIADKAEWKVPGRKVAVHPGSHGSANNLAMPRYAELIAALVAAGWQVWVTGTAAERQTMAGLPWHLAGVVDATGEMDVLALMGFLGQTQLCIAASTGPLHLAAAMGTPVVGLFGAAAPVWPERWRPIGPHVDVLVADRAAPDGGLDLEASQIVMAAERATDRAARSVLD